MLNLSNPALIQVGSYIDGKWVTGSNTAKLPVVNPATNEVIIELASLNDNDAKIAIEGAHEALPAWRNKTALERAAILRRWYELIHENIDDLALILTAEQGKPLAEARGEVLYGASYLEWYAEEAKRINGDLIPQPSQDKRLMVMKQPVGVVGSITPWNFPNASFTRKFAPALAAGCTFVGRPASETPLSATSLAVLAEEAGVPKGVFNVLVGDHSIGQELTSNPLVKKISFTGSTPVGKMLMQQAAETCKKTSMELGGNAPFIVFEDADIDAAIAGAMASKFRNAGQTCVCANRLMVHSSIAETFTNKLAEKAAAFQLGNGQDPDTTMGPLINQKAVQDVTALVDEAIQRGAKVVTGGKPSDLGGNFFEPTVLRNVDQTCRVFNEEIFGPVAPIFTFDTEEEAIAMANDTEFGLASYFYTQDLNRAWRVSEALEYGIVGLNEGIISNAMAPFGGIKESGSGREGAKYGLDDYLEIKYVCMGGLDKDK